ncbi:hypothetical protein RVR34_13715 [Microcystis aeruginosa FBCC-A68]|nr:hypothetical protein [Microcystis aeruginosa]
MLIYEDINIKYQETSIDLSKLARFLSQWSERTPVKPLRGLTGDESPPE